MVDVVIGLIVSALATGNSVRLPEDLAGCLVSKLTGALVWPPDDMEGGVVDVLMGLFVTVPAVGDSV